MANNIKFIRERNGMKQEKLAEILGINPCTLSNKEAGRRPFTVEEVLKIEELFGVSVREMFEKVGE